MNRRGALITIGLTAFSTAAWSVSKPLRLFRSNAMPAGVASGGAQSKNTIEERLRKDMARLKPRVYSEEGIPMFLGCQNLVTNPDSRVRPKVSLTPLNAALASELRRNAEAFKHIQPDVQAKDVAPIIEVLADRDFTNGGTVEAA